MSDAKSQKTKKPINQNLTVPNAMSVFRILVIPFFAYFFLKGNLTAHWGFPAFPMRWTA